MKALVIAGSLVISIALLASGAEAQTNPDPGTVMMEAVSTGHTLGNQHLGVAAVARALERGVDINAQDNAGWTALMYAAEEGLPDVADYLLRSGADTNVRSANGETALLIASACYIVRVRASNVRPRNLPDWMAQKQLDTPRSIAANLIAHHADVNAKRNDGRTALMSAVMMGWPEVAKILLDAGADVNAHDLEGRLAVDYAEPVRDPEVIDLLRRAGSEAGSGRSGRSVCDAQVRLAELGYQPGPPDCLLGNATRAALRQFQGGHNLSVSGELDSLTIEALGIRR
jgi:ankyrin repeat protein